MRIGTPPIFPFLLLLLLLLALPGNLFARDLYSFDIAADFTTGDYGTGQTTETYSTAVALGYYPTERLNFSLSTNYLYQSSSTTTSTGGIIFGREDESGTTTDTTGPVFGSGSTTTSTETEQSRSGFGDLYLSGGFKLLTENKQRPEIKVVGYVKFPTADEDEGLGTGETDYSIGAEVRKWIDLWHP
ncbi:MAG: hypothetical protein GWN87_31380, partial [Desulfuromonadales bacterium]|nr:hypothetical protein [Desulfuromonadales bacterium]NIS44044.1 hypothetical protein [Desulfuromonadales bacterium]